MTGSLCINTGTEPLATDRRLARPGWREGASPLLGLVIVVLLFAWSWHSIDVDVERLAGSLPRFAEFFGRMVPPDLSVAETVARSTVETLQIVLLGTILSAIV